ncbi:MAG: flagellar biosynthetic protein FliR [Bryobacteraceae bacterium]
MPAEPALPLNAVFGFLLVLARVSGALVFVPLPGVTAGPKPARAALALGFTFALFPLWPRALPAEPSIGLLVVWIAAEAAFGITVGLAVAFLTESMLVAGQLLGQQAGYSYAATIDPLSQNDSNVLIVFAQLLAGLLFFSLGLDRQILRIFAQSLSAYPPGTYLPNLRTAEAIIRLGSGTFETGLRMAMPVIVLLVLVDISLALLGRINQQLQLLTLAFPVKMLAMLAFLATISVLFLPIYRGAAGRTISTLLALH